MEVAVQHVYRTGNRLLPACSGSEGSRAWDASSGEPCWEGAQLLLEEHPSLDGHGSAEGHLVVPRRRPEGNNDVVPGKEKGTPLAVGISFRICLGEFPDTTLPEQLLRRKTWSWEMKWPPPYQNSGASPTFVLMCRYRWGFHVWVVGSQMPTEVDIKKQKSRLLFLFTTGLMLCSSVLWLQTPLSSLIVCSFCRVLSLSSVISSNRIHWLFFLPV